MRPVVAYKAKELRHNQPSSYRGAYRVASLNYRFLYTVVSFVCACVTFVIFTDCQNFTRPTSTHPGCMEASDHGLTCGMCFVARRLEVVAVSGLLWISSCILGAAGFRFFFFFSTSNDHGLAQV